MPKIRPYTQQTTAQGTIGGRSATASDFGFGQEIESFGNTVQATAKFVQKEKENQEVEDAQLRMAEARQHWTEDYLNRQNSSAPGDMSMGEGMRKDMDGYFEKMGNDYTTDAAKKYVKLHGSSMTTSFFSKSLVYQRSQARAKARANVSAAIDAAQNSVYADPSTYENTKNALLADVRNGAGVYRFLKNDAEKSKIEKKIVDDISVAAGMAAIRDPMVRAQILGQYSGGGGKADESKLPEFFRDLDFDKKDRLIRTAKAYQKQEDGVARKALVQQVKNHEAYVALNSAPPPTDEQLTRLDFKDDETGWKTYNAMLVAATTIEDTADMKFDDGWEEIQKLKPTDAEVDDPAFADKVSIYEQSVKLFTARTKAVIADPIQAEMNRDYAPGTGGITPIEFDKPEQLVDDIIKRLPVAEDISSKKGLPLKILSKAESKVFAERFSRMGVDDQMDMLAELSQKKPEIITPLFDQAVPGGSSIRAAAGIVASEPDSIQNGEYRDQTVGYILLGENLMKSATSKGSEGEKAFRSKQLPSISDMYKQIKSMGEYEDMSIEFVKTLPDAMEAVRAHYVGKKASDGEVDFSVSSDVSAFKDSVKTVIGSPSKVGSTKVIRPWGMSENDFLEGVRARVPATYGSYGLRKPMGAPASVYEVIQGGVTGMYIDLDKPVPLFEKDFDAVTGPTSSAGGQ